MVADLRWEAALDSSGEFSMHSSAALEKLARFQLQDPQRYLLAAVAAGCAAGAQEIVITVRPDSCKIELVGWLDLQLEAMRELFATLLCSDPALTPLRYLARAVLGAAGLNPYYVTLHRVDESGRNSGGLRLMGKRFDRVASWGRGRPGLCLFVQEKAHAGVFQRLFGSWMGAQSPTTEMLIANCGFSSVPIRVNGQLIQCLPRLGECQRVWKLGDVQGHWQGNPLVTEHPAEANFRALVGWSSTPAWGCPCAAVVHGVQYPLDPKLFGPQYGRGVIWCDDARLDLSLENVVEDEGWKAHLKALKEVYEAV